MKMPSYDDLEKKIAQLQAELDSCREKLKKPESITHGNKIIGQDELHYKEVFDSTSDAIFIHDAETGQIIDVNETMLKMYGYSKEDALKLTVEEASAIDCGFNSALAIEKIKSTTKEGTNTFEWLAKHKNGKYFWVEVSLKKTKIWGKDSILAVVRDIADRIEAEKALQMRESYLTAIIENQPGLVWLKDEKNSFLAINRAFVISCGKKTKEEVIGKTDFDVWPKDLAVKYWEDDQKVLQSGTYLITEELVNDKGEIKWFETFKTPVFNDTGRIIGSTGLARDISERKQFEEALKMSEEKFRLLALHVPGTIYLCNNDEKYTMLFLNDQVEELTGYSKEEFLSGKLSFVDLYHPEDKPEIFKQVDLAVLNHQSFNLIYRIWHKDGTMRWLEEHGTGIYENNKLLYLEGFILDITERKQAEVILQKEKQFSESLVQNLPSIFYLYNENLELQKWNKLHETALGYSGEELKDFHISGWRKKENADFQTLDDLKNIFKDKKSRINEVTLLHKNGKEIPYLVTADFIETPEGPMMMGIGLDISRLKETENELIIAKEKAEESDRLKTAFLQNMSHEIRTPMNAIIGFSNLLKKNNLTEEKKDNYANIIIDSTNQLLSIVTNILTIASLDTGQEKIVPEKVCLNSLMDNIYSILNQGAVSKGITLQSIIPKDENIQIYTDKTKLTQIITNLVTNSLKFTHLGYVEYGYSVKDKNVEFYVKDTGIGIKPEMLEKIFERFRQANLSINKLYGGTGLGLSISKGFVEMMGGKIWVVSEPGRGSTFYFNIPYDPVETKDENYTKSLEPKLEKIILIAEDEEFNFLYFKELFQDTDMKLIHVPDGLEAVEKCKVMPEIDLVLMDIKMPMLDGYEATKLIKEFRPNLPIIAQSAYALEHELEKYSAVFDDYITKPINSDRLIDVIEKIFKK